MPETKSVAKKAYASCRSSGGGKAKCAKISWVVQKPSKRSRDK